MRPRRFVAGVAALQVVIAGAALVVTNVDKEPAITSQRTTTTAVADISDDGSTTTLLADAITPVGSPTATGSASTTPSGAGTTVPGSTVVLGDTTVPPTTTAGAPTTADLRLAPKGLGAAEVGMTVDQVSSILGRRLRGLGGERAPACEIYAPESGLDGVAFMMASGRLVRVDVIAAGVTTTTGLAVGQAQAEAQSRYGGRLQASANPAVAGGQVLTLVPDAPDQNFRVVIETDGKVVTAMRSGRLPEVGTPVGCLQG